jgi:hypothetical protein
LFVFSDITSEVNRLAEKRKFSNPITKKSKNKNPTKYKTKQKKKNQILRIKLLSNIFIFVRSK